MDQATFRSHIRFLAADLDTSNLVQHELLSERPGNIYDGVNTVFTLFNRRICSLTLYNKHNVEISATDYTLSSGTGRIVFNTPPAAPGDYADYYFQKLTDAELDMAITTAAAAAGFDVTNVAGSSLDYASLYALAYCYMSMASKAGEYYTLSAAGKQVSKSEIFNHYQALATNTLRKAQDMRTDMLTERGSRETPAEGHGACSWVQPYISDSGGG